MNKKILFILAIIALAVMGALVWWLGYPGLRDGKTLWSGDKNETPAAKYAGKKILYIDSYNEGYDWSDGVTRGIKSALEGTGITLEIIRMDTKRNPDEEFKKSAAAKAKAEIEKFKPDVLLVSDDNAFKYVVKEYYRDAGLPVVFSGLNWDASIYEAPYRNTTGMVEVSLTNQIIDHLKVFTKGSRLGYISADNETERKNLVYYGSLLNIKFDKVYFAKDFSEWKKRFKQLQKEVDLVIFENNAGIAGWDEAEAESFALAETKVPVGTTNNWIMKYALLGITKIPEEQGEWQAAAALQILGGASPSEIPLVKNKKGKLIINLKLANKMNIVFDPSVLRNAEVAK